MKLTHHFYQSEFTNSETAQEQGIENKPSPAEIVNMIALCAVVLEKVRAEFGKPVKITSGYRSPELNKAIGGAKRSQHMKGEAADFVISGVDLDEIYEWISANLKYDQLIREPSWIHVSYKRNGKNRQMAWVK